MKALGLQKRRYHSVPKVLCQGPGRRPFAACSFSKSIPAALPKRLDGKAPYASYLELAISILLPVLQLLRACMSRSVCWLPSPHTCGECNHHTSGIPSPVGDDPTTRQAGEPLAALKRTSHCATAACRSVLPWRDMMAAPAARRAPASRHAPNSRSWNEVCRLKPCLGLWSPVHMPSRSCRDG